MKKEIINPLISNCPFAVHVTEFSGSTIDGERVESDYPIVLYRGPDCIDKIAINPLELGEKIDFKKALAIETAMAIGAFLNRRNRDGMKDAYQDLKNGDSPIKFASQLVAYWTPIAIELIAFIPIVIATIATIAIFLGPLIAMIQILGA